LRTVSSFEKSQTQNLDHDTSTVSSGGDFTTNDVILTDRVLQRRGTSFNASRTIDYSSGKMDATSTPALKHPAKPDNLYKHSFSAVQYTFPSLESTNLHFYHPLSHASFQGMLMFPSSLGDVHGRREPSHLDYKALSRAWGDQTVSMGAFEDILNQYDVYQTI
jgi:hypothetical protein